MKQIDAFEMRLSGLLAAFFLFCLWLFLTGCHTAKSDTKKVAAVDYRHPLVLAGYCASKYPPTDSTSIVKEYIQGEDIVFSDTVVRYEMHSDTVFATKWLTKTIKTTDTIRDTRYVQQENKALIVLRDAELKVCGAELIKKTESRDNWRMWALIGWGIIGLSVIVWIVRTYLKGRIKILGNQITRLK